MASPLRLLLCEHFRAETEAVLAEIGQSDVQAKFFPACCGHPALSPGELIAAAGDAPAGSPGAVIGSACLANVKSLPDNLAGFSLVQQETCFQMVAGRDFLRELTAGGAYLITPGWLAGWRSHVASWGDAAIVRRMFAESVVRLVLLDTGSDSHSHEYLVAMAAYVERPFETVRVGLDYFRMFLENEIGKLRLERRQQPPTEGGDADALCAADYAMALELLGDIPRTEREEAVIARIADLFRMLFSSRYFHLLSIADGNAGRLWSFPTAAEPQAVYSRLASFDQPYEVLPESGGFRLLVGSPGAALAVIEAGGVLLVEHLPRYLNLALHLVKLIALALQNARVFEQRETLLADLQRSLAEVNRLSGLLPICAHCKKIRNDQGYWQQVEVYVSEHSQADFSHGICPDCLDEFYPEVSAHLKRKRGQEGGGAPAGNGE